jgi:NAD(P)-dependent dehydrogenase (short-subunit alcohol dehydrogenase family)
MSINWAEAVMGSLDGKVAVVTGGSAGIGLATAKRFADEGAHVFITGRRVPELEKAADEIGGNVTAIEGDIAKLDDLDRLFDAIRSAEGGLDIVVANAAYVQEVTLAQATVEHFETTFDVNARGTFFTMKKALPLLRDGASVVLISSVSHLLGLPVHTTYAATKAAIRSYGRTWAAELAPRGIRVNVISPGPVDTPIYEAQTYSQQEADQLRSFYASQVPLGRLGEPDEIAAAALFLVSDQSTFITGVDLAVAGGLSQV